MSELIVVTLVVAAEGGVKVPKITSREELTQALNKLGALRSEQVCTWPLDLLLMFADNSYCFTFALYHSWSHRFSGNSDFDTNFGLLQILAVEVMWTPQDENDSYSRDELFLDYPTLHTL